MGRLKNGCVHIYTGNGKGKTTAAVGLAIRAAGAGLKVYICQFIKAGNYSEIKILKKIKNVKVDQCGMGYFIKNNPKEADVNCARGGFEKARRLVLSGKYDLVIMDELNIAMKLGFIKEADVLELIGSKPSCVELVITGRNCPQRLLRHADTVTRMQELKHHYNNGIKARRGIEY